MTTTFTDDKRPGERISLSGPTMVKGKQDIDQVWKERTDLVSVSRTGAGFYLSRKCEIGSLLSLIIPMPKHHRSYDREKELYRVWGIVQHTHYLPEHQRFQVGVAFIGRDAPQSYLRNPNQSYRITGINEDGLWRVSESERPFVTRKHPRFTVEIPVTLATVDENGASVLKDKSVTANISLRGAAVISGLPVESGDCVRFSTSDPEFSVVAVVRNTHEMVDGSRRVNLEFVTADFPVLRLPSEMDPRTDEEAVTAVTDSGDSDEADQARGDL